MTTLAMIFDLIPLWLAAVMAIMLMMVASILTYIAFDVPKHRPLEMEDEDA